MNLVRTYAPLIIYVRTDTFLKGGVSLSCYSPNYIVYNDGEVGRFGGRLTQSVLDSSLPGQQIVPVPCGRCEGCRLDYGKRWADRMLVEYHTPREYGSERAIFVTFTYDNAHLPYVTCTDNVPRPSLQKRDWQLFMKRLRKHFKCRFLVAGEYGDNTFRPHYHAIIFGISLSDIPDLVVYSHDPDLDTTLYSSVFFDSIWSNGACKIAVANYYTMSYTGRYILKKQYRTDNVLDFYKGRQLPFILTSRRPGIGADLFDSVDTSKIAVNDGNDVHLVARPRVNLDKLELTNPDEYYIIKHERRSLAEDRRSFIEDATGEQWLSWLKGQRDNLVRNTRFSRDKV